MARFYYGGQAVIEGVMMRGQRHMAVAVRASDGCILVYQEPLHTALYYLVKLPVLRGLLALWDAVGLGMKAMIFSVDVANGPGKHGRHNIPAMPLHPVTRWPESAAIFSASAAPTATTTALPFIPADRPTPALVKVTAASGSLRRYSGLEPGAVGFAAGIAVAATVGIFFVLPVLVAGLLTRLPGVHSEVARNLIEGVIRLGLFMSHIWLVGYLPDIRRLFGYHGAEHKAINAYEADAPLTPQVVQNFDMVNLRCGTTFLFLVLVVTTIVFVFIVGLPAWATLLSRIVLVPVIAALVYEFVRFMAALYHLPVVRVLLSPALALQKMTTRPPDLSMIEVAVTALQTVLAADRATQARAEVAGEHKEHEAKKEDYWRLTTED